MVLAKADMVAVVKWVTGEFFPHANPFFVSRIEIFHGWVL